MQECSLEEPYLGAISRIVRMQGAGYLQVEMRVQSPRRVIDTRVRIHRLRRLQNVLDCDRSALIELPPAFSLACLLHQD